MKKSIILLLVPFLSFCQLEKYENFMPTSLTGEVGHQQYYSFSFSKKYESSEWTIYYSNKKTLEYKYPRQNRFRDNPDYPEYDNRDFAAYYRSGYDRGHMVPARSMSFDSDAMAESFYSTNVTPMLPIVNRGIWKLVEQKEHDWVREKNELILITGVIYKDEKYGVPIPNLYIPAFTYKVIIDIVDFSGIGLVVPNDKSIYYDENGTTTKFYQQSIKEKSKEERIKSYVHTIDEIEDLTGIDFNYKLPRSIQKSLESKVNIRDWFEIDENPIGGKKLALLIGNNDYIDEKDKLENPINDALKMEETFRKLDFDSIIVKKNLDYSQLKNTFSNYKDLRDDYDFGVVYYAGHGIQDESENSYLIPVDYDNSSELNKNSFSVNDFIEDLKDEQKNDILILDACRETSSSTISKSNVKGLKSMKIGYSTLSGYPAYDHPELNNSLYTKILSESLLNSGLTIYEIFHQTKIKVLLQSFHRQIPDQAFGDNFDNYLLK